MSSSIVVGGITIEWPSSMDPTDSSNATALLSQQTSLTMISNRANQVRAGFVVSKIKVRGPGHSTTSTNGVPAPDPDGGHLTLFVHPPAPAPGAGKIPMHLYYTPDTPVLGAGATPRFAR